MPLRILCDENVPGAIIEFLKQQRLDVVRVVLGSSDPQIAEVAKAQKRVILTFDSDFANILEYPPDRFFGIIRIDISPPFVDVVTNSLKMVFAEFREAKHFRGKLIIAGPARFRVWEAEP